MNTLRRLVKWLWPGPPRVGEYFSFGESPSPWCEVSLAIVTDVAPGWVRYQYASARGGEICVIPGPQEMRTRTFMSIYSRWHSPDKP